MIRLIVLGPWVSVVTKFDKKVRKSVRKMFDLPKNCDNNIPLICDNFTLKRS